MRSKAKEGRRGSGAGGEVEEEAQLGEVDPVDPGWVLHRLPTRISTHAGTG